MKKLISQITSEYLIRETAKYVLSPTLRELFDDYDLKVTEKDLIWTKKK